MFLLVSYNRLIRGVQWYKALYYNFKVLLVCLLVAFADKHGYIINPSCVFLHQAPTEKHNLNVIIWIRDLIIIIVIFLGLLQPTKWVLKVMTRKFKLMVKKFTNINETSNPLRNVACSRLWFGRIQYYILLSLM